MSGKPAFFAELKRRNVPRAALLYAGATWALAQGLAQLAPAMGLPDWVTRWFLIAAVIGFPFWIVFAWYYELTPEGLKRTHEVAPGESIAPRTGRHMDFWIIGIIAIAVLLLANTLVRRNGPMPESAPATAAATAEQAVPAAQSTAASSAATVIPAKSIAVLPFENLSADKNNGYFADGMQDLILTKLADIGDLKVISRTSTREYGSKPENLRRIARQLGVATILEGSVQKAGNQVLINVQLIDARSDTHLWANTYQRTLDNIFGVEGEVAGKIADALKAKLSPAEAAAVANVPTRNPAAYDAYLRGERFFNDAFATANFKLLHKAVAAFRQAVEQDSSFAQSWAQLAMSQGALVYASIDRSDTALCRKSLANARHALALAPDMPLGHLVLGYAYRFCLADYDRALDQFRIARKGLPNNAGVEAAIAYIQWQKGDVRAAAAGLQRAVSLDPRTPDRTIYLALTFEALGQYDRADAGFKRALALAPDDPEAWSGLAYLAVLQHGNVGAALATLDRAPAGRQTGAEILSTRVDLLLLKRDYAAARQAVAQLQPGGRAITPMSVALLRAKVERLSGDEKGAKAMYRQVLALASDPHAAKSGENALNVQTRLPIAYAGLGQRDKALQAVSDMRMSFKHHGGNVDDLAQLKLAQIHVLLGNGDAAIAPLDAALAAPLRRVISVPLLKIDPFWDPIRKDPRFQALLAKYAKRLPDQARNGAGDG